MAPKDITGFLAAGVLFVVGMLLLGFGGGSAAIEQKEIWAASGQDGSCIIVHIGGVATSCSQHGQNCASQFTLTYAPVDYQNRQHKQYIPLGADGLSPFDLKLGQIIDCYSLNFASDVTVVWKRQSWSSYSIILLVFGIIVGLAFLALVGFIAFIEYNKGYSHI